MTETTETRESSSGPAYLKAIEGIRLQHQQSAADQMAAQAKHNEELRRAINAEAVPGLSGEGEEVGSTLTIDSPTTVHNYGTAAKDEDASKANRKTLGTIAKLAIGAGLIATGAGIPFGAGIIGDALLSSRKADPEPAQPGEAIRYLLDLGEPIE